MTRFSERDLDEAFVGYLLESAEFERWLLSKTKLAMVNANLDRDEPWQFRWYRSPRSGIESETDIFLRFRNLEDDSHFALHIENKLATGSFRPNQPALYHERAEERAEGWRYQDWQTILIAPLVFQDRYRKECDKFDVYIPYEELARFIPAFAV